MGDREDLQPQVEDEDLDPDVAEDLGVEGEDADAVIGGAVGQEDDDPLAP